MGRSFYNKKFKKKNYSYQYQYHWKLNQVLKLLLLVPMIKEFYQYRFKIKYFFFQIRVGKILPVPLICFRAKVKGSCRIKKKFLLVLFTWAPTEVKVRTRSAKSYWYHFLKIAPQLRTGSVKPVTGTVKFSYPIHINTFLDPP